jgi:hypothetical protein
MNICFDPRRRAVVFAGLLAGAGLLVVGEIAWFRGRQQAQAVATADEVVAARVEAARAHLARHDWDEAVRLLHEALGVEKAHRRNDVELLLTQAEKGQAQALLDAARAALGRKEVERARGLLRDYRAHPHALGPDGAGRLEADLARATDDAAAVRRLEHWSDATLALFAELGQLDNEEWKGDESLRDLFKDTLSRHVPQEQQKRQARRGVERRAATQREARLRDTEPFRDLVRFLAEARARLREEDRLARRQDQALEQLFRQVAVRGVAERERLRASLTASRQEWKNDFRAAAARKQAEAKAAFRRSTDFTPADAEVFDRLVDRELDALRQE